KRLWDSWEEGAVLLDRERGIFAEDSRIHAIDIAGKRRFEALGPLTVPRSPQRYPVFVQAGGSDRGRNFAATHAHAIITHQNTTDDMRAFRNDIRGRCVKLGRNPDDVKVFFTVK